MRKSLIAVFVLGASHIAYSACKVPSQSSEYCFTLPLGVYGSCQENSQSHCGSGTFPAVERNQFPIGWEISTTGVVTENEQPCWRRLHCVWDPDEGECISDGNPAPWHSGDKIEVDNESSCPAS